MTFFEEIANFGRAIVKETKRNELETGPGTFGYAGQVYDIEYYNKYGEFPHETKLKKLNIE